MDLDLAEKCVCGHSRGQHSKADSCCADDCDCEKFTRVTELTLEHAGQLIGELFERVMKLEAEVRELRCDKAVLYGDQVQIGYSTHEHFTLVLQGWIDRKPALMDIKARG